MDSTLNIGLTWSLNYFIDILLLFSCYCCCYDLVVVVVIVVVVVVVAAYVGPLELKLSTEIRVALRDTLLQS